MSAASGSPGFTHSKSPVEVQACAHCGDPLDAGAVVARQVGGVAAKYCCHGCAFIAEQLFIARATQRDVVALQLEREPHGAAAAVPEHERVTFAVQGMVCAACALLIESRLHALAGVSHATVDFGARRATVAFDPSVTVAERLRAAIASWGYATDRDAAQTRRAAHFELARVLLAWLAMMQVMMLAFPAYVAAPGEIAPDVEQLLRIAQLVLTVPVMLFCAAPLLRAAANQLRMRAVGMDVPIVLGLLAAFGAGVQATALAQGDVYFDSITMFVALVLGSRWVQAHALARAHRVIEDAERAVTHTARRLRSPAGAPGDAGVLMAHDVVAARDLAPGDQVWVLAGEAFPADGLIAAGTSSVSQAWLMGEARPVGVVPGSGVLAGSVNLEAPVTLEVTRAGEATSLASLRRLVDRAGESRPRVMETAQRIAAAFLWIVLAVAAGTLLVWAWLDPAQALPNALAVLIATCPCALSLAAPTVFTAAQSSLARRGVLVARAAALETLASVDTFAFDKTGTLTTNAPKLERVSLVRALDQQRALGVAAALASVSVHPFARALVEAATAGKLDVPMPLATRVFAGQGVEATVWGRRYRLGRFDFALEPVAASRSRHMTRMQTLAGRAAKPASGLALLADDAGPVALFVFGESLREGAAEAVRDLRALGVTPLIVSGDRRETVRRAGALADIVAPSQVHAEMRPQDKRARIAALQAAGRRVAMIGDGINDAPVLAQADVSLALGAELGGAALAQTRADFIVLNADLRQVAAAVAVSRRAMALVQQNFVWALAYNVTVLPLAAVGWLSPALAAIGMAASSLIVVGNALRMLHDRRTEN